MSRSPLLAAPLLCIACALGWSCSSGSDGGGEPTCPENTKSCGDGCIPLGGVCCASAADPTTSSYCTNAAGACLPNESGDAGVPRCAAAFPSGSTAEYCCASNSDVGSNDCPPGQHHCGLLCQSAPCGGGAGPTGGATTGGATTGGGCTGFEGTYRLCEEDFNGCYCLDDLPESECITDMGQACMPEGSAGCAKSFWTGSSGSTSVIAPCCPGLYCVVGDACGSTGDTCLPGTADAPCDAPAQGHCVMR